MKKNLFAIDDHTYWKKMYGNLDQMDGVFNAKEHCRYIQSLFDLEIIHINKIVEFGCGYGHILKNLISTFHPISIEVVEPSPLALNKAKSKNKKTYSTKISYNQETIQDWCKKNNSKTKVYDLAVCNSVFQYIPSKDLKNIIRVLSKKFRYLYVTIPTDKEYLIQQKDEKYFDPYAIARSMDYYRNLFKKHFTIVGSRVLESKFHFNEKTTSFTELLFRE